MSNTFEGSYLGDASKLADDARLECGICWWVYDPAAGDDLAQIPSGTPFSRLPDSWHCPTCDADKDKFLVIGSAPGSRREDGALSALVNAYRAAATRMRGLPIYNPELTVEAVGFRELADGRSVGVIVTPWFMNLTVIPAAREQAAWRVGDTLRLDFPSGSYDFLVNEIAALGRIASCSLFSPMDMFTDHEAAHLSAESAARALHEPAENARDEHDAPRLSRRTLLGG